jgi:hypothetical protein
MTFYVYNRAGALVPAGFLTDSSGAPIVDPNNSTNPNIISGAQAIVLYDVVGTP